MTEIDNVQDFIAREFEAMGDPFDQYECLLRYAMLLPVLGEDKKTEENLVEGCQSRVWLSLECADGMLVMEADSDTLIVRGVLYLLVRILSGQSCFDVAHAKVLLLEQTGLSMLFDARRREGVSSIVSKVQGFAALHAEL